MHLSSLGDPQSTNIDGESYKKIINYNDNSNDDTLLAIYVFSYKLIHHYCITI